MPLAKAVRLGFYEILDPLGAGGMGEVYRARDMRLGREVAVKVLPAAFSADSERLRRFEQEARSAGALNHPNILAIHDVGTHEGVPFLITELLEGETLRERLREGPLPVRKALDVAIQAAHGVAAAHEKGIIHRDLKPANIFLTTDGRVKILDFGLAKLTQQDVSGMSETQSPTRTAKPLTQTEAGVVLGTVGYMSPEQVRGKPADARSDIFALGTILYEMLSGQRAFEKDSSADTMAAILKEEPPELSGEGKKIPPAVDRVVRHCLEKNSAERFQSARDLAFDLETLSGASTTATAALAAAKSPARKWLMPLTAIVVALILGATGEWIFSRGGAGTEQPTYHQLTFDQGLIYSARFAADGQSIYYSAAWNGQPVQLYSTNPNSPESRALNQSNSGLFAVSPSDMAISIGCKDVFIGDCEGTLATVPISGGAPHEIADNVVSADWTSDSAEIAAIREVGGKYQVEFPLGKVIYQSVDWLDFLRVAPNGQAVAFADFTTPNGDIGRVVILDRTGKQIARSTVFPSVEGVAWPPAGKEVWFAATRHQAWANGIHALDFSGRERIILRLPGMLRLQDISRDGRVLLSKDNWWSGMQFRSVEDAKERDLSWLDSPVVSDLSPDGRTVAFMGAGSSAGGSEFVAYIRATGGTPAIKLGRYAWPVLSLDGNWVLASLEPGPGLVLAPTGAGESKTLDESGIQQFTSYGWMPGDTQIYFGGNDGHDWRMYLQDVAGGAPRAVTPPILVRPQYFESHLVSPDGKLVFARDLNGKGWLYPLAGGKPTAVPGLSPEDIWVNWTADGRSAFVYQDDKTHAQVFRLDLLTGKRQIVTTLAPADTAGLTSISPVKMTANGKFCAYTFGRSLSDLFLAEGAK